MFNVQFLCKRKLSCKWNGKCSNYVQISNRKFLLFCVSLSSTTSILKHIVGSENLINASRANRWPISYVVIVTLGEKDGTVQECNETGSFHQLGRKQCKVNAILVRDRLDYNLCRHYTSWQGGFRSNMCIFHHVHLRNEQMHLQHPCALAHMSFSTWMSYVHLLICDALLRFCMWTAYSVMVKYIVKFSHGVCHFFYCINCCLNLTLY